MANFNGQLNANEIFAAIYNMIISQFVFADNIAKKQTLVDKNKVDGTLYGDTKLYYSTDVLKSYEFGNDAEASELLRLYRPEAPKVQAIVMNIARQIPVTIDNYLSKKAWSTEGAFSTFTSVTLDWLNETKRIYDAKTYNVFVGTNETKIGSQSQTVELSTIGGTEEEKNRLRAQKIAQKMANIFDELEDANRDYNDYGHMRSYSLDDLEVIWNSAYVNEITKLDLPTVFNREGLMDKFAENRLLPKFFGNLNTESGTTPEVNTTIRSAVEKTFGEVHLFPGDLLPGNTAYAENETYTVDPKIICKIVHKGSAPYMSAFAIETSFFNPKSLTENHYLTFGHNTIEHLKNYPWITLKEV